MKQLKELVEHVPISVDNFVIVRGYLDIVIIFHNDHGLAGVMVKCLRQLLIEPNIPSEVGVAMKFTLSYVLKNTSLSIDGFDVRVRDKDKDGGKWGVRTVLDPDAETR